MKWQAKVKSWSRQKVQTLYLPAHIFANDGSLLLCQQFCCRLEGSVERTLSPNFFSCLVMYSEHDQACSEYILFLILCLLHDFGKFSLLLVASVNFFFNSSTITTSISMKSLKESDCLQCSTSSLFFIAN